MLKLFGLSINNTSQLLLPKAIKKITIDPDEQTADVDLSNNSWSKITDNKFEKFKKEKIKS